MTSINELLNRHFPNHRINDASNRSIHDLVKLEQLCLNNPSFLVYFIKNDLNAPVFDFLQKKSRGSNKKAGLVFLHKADYYYFGLNAGDNYADCILTLRKQIEGDTKCPICLEDCSRGSSKTIICEQCASSFHKKCLTIRSNCPVCNYDKFFIGIV